MELTEPYPRSAREPVRLQAIEPPWVDSVRADPHLLGDLADAAGGPFHVLHPPTFATNLAAFRAALADAGVDGAVYFGKKANKAGCWLRECARTDTGVDVASAPELVHALGSGVRGDQLVVTGPAKTDELVWLALRHGALVTVDALDELHRLLAVEHSGGPARILLRVCPAADPHSRFGLTDDELAHALDRCSAAPDRVVLEGFSFHLSGYAVAPRAWQASDLIDRCLAARARGLAARSVSIGGGFAVNYVNDADWQRFQRDWRDDWFHAGHTFREFYPYHSAPAGAAMLAGILAAPVPSGHADLAAELRATGTRLLLEPGRSLLDGCGVTVFPVLGYKDRGDYGIVTVHGLSMSVSEQWFDSEYLPDPRLWPPAPGTPTSACVGGSSCLEVDMLTWRKIGFDRRPRPGDLLIYPNTAGYQADSNESEFHQLPLPPRFVVTTDAGRWRWRVDS